MANIRINVNYAIKDGSEIVFRSPVDCSAVTGLIMYYKGEDENTTSKEFSFADAHGNNVGDIPHLFAENVVVKVILDVESGMAYVQNADTNAYIEGRFAEIMAELNCGVTSWNDLPDKPFGEEGGEVELFPETTVTFTFEGSMGTVSAPAMFALVDGETYRAVVDGSSHEIVCVSEGGVLLLPHLVQDTSTGDFADGTFVIAYTPAAPDSGDPGTMEAMIVDSTNTPNHTLALYQGGGVKTLDAKYLPMDAIDARIDAKLAEIPDVSEVGM